MLSRSMAATHRAHSYPQVSCVPAARLWCPPSPEAGRRLFGNPRRSGPDRRPSRRPGPAV